MTPKSHALLFFALTFAWTWGLQVPGVLAQRGILPGDLAAYLPFVGLGIFGPTVAALLLTHREGGWPAVKGLVSRVLHWRVDPWCYVLALAPPLLLAAFLVLLNAAGRTGPLAYLPSLGGLVLGVVISLAEELGWRGFALPRLQRRWGNVGASGILGVAWYAWHLPMFAGQGVPMNLVLVMLLFFVGASLMLTWVYNAGKGSLAPVVLAHLGAHLNNSHRALPEDVVPFLAHAIVFAALGILVWRGVLLRSPARSLS